MNCVNLSLQRSSVFSGVLPKNCVAFTAYDDGNRDVFVLHEQNYTDISYYETIFSSFPLPKMVFGFRISKEGRIFNCRLGVVANDTILKPTTPMYHYPFSNVDGCHICIGNNAMPKCESIHNVSSLPFFILSMPNNNDHFTPNKNKLGFEMRDLLELMKDKTPEFYYSDILIPSGQTLNDFVS